MIDKLKISFQLEHSPVGEAGIAVVDRSTGEIINGRSAGYSLEGSYSSKAVVRSKDIVGDVARTIEIEGSPAKFLQGHNLWGSNDLRQVAEAYLLAVFESLGLEVCEASRSAIKRGVYKVYAVDINENYHAGSLAGALDYINRLAACNRQFRTLEYTRGTVYLDQDNRRRSFRVYAKGLELEAHPLPANLPHRAELLAYAQDLVRVELVLKAQQLITSKLNTGSAWGPTTADALFNRYRAKINEPANPRITSEAIASLKPHYYRTYSEWLKGSDMLLLLPSRPTRYRHQKFFRDNFGIEILSNPAAASLLPDWEELSLRQASPPAWALENILHTPQQTQVAS